MACFKSQEKSKMDYWEYRKKRNGKKGRQTHETFDATIKHQGMETRALKEPLECITSNGLEIYLGESIDEIW